MKMFLKIVLLVILAVVAVKFLPLLFGLGWLLAVAVVGLLAFGASAVAALFGTMIALAVLLSPIWVPVLALIGLITLIKRSTRNSRVVAT